MEAPKPVERIMEAEASFRRKKMAATIFMNPVLEERAIDSAIKKYAKSLAAVRVVTYDPVLVPAERREEMWLEWFSRERIARVDAYVQAYTGGGAAREVEEMMLPVLDECHDTFDALHYHSQGDRLEDMPDMTLRERKRYISEILAFTASDEVKKLAINNHYPSYRSSSNPDNQ